MRAQTLRALLPITALFLAAGAAATPISDSGFSGSQTLESFEGIGAGGNVGASAYANIVLPAISTSFTFGSGVTLTSPVPNPGLFNNGPFVHDAAIGGAVNNWGANGTVANAGNVPDVGGTASSAYLGAFDNVGAGSASITLTFASDMLRVGAYVAGAAGSTIQLSAYDGSGALLETVVIAAPTVAAWGTSGSFLGLERVEGIRTIVFTGADFGLDGLTFEPNPIPVPEPATLATVALGVALLALRRRTP
jgi:hypothetical protein